MASAVPTSTTSDALSSTVSSGPTATCTTAVPDQYGHVPLDACNSVYQFDPSFAGNLSFAVLFGLTTLAHLVQAFAFKKRFCWVVIMASTWELVAFVLRTLGTRNQQEVTYAVLGNVLFLLAPLWINAFVYMTIARLVYFVLPDRQVWRVNAAWLTKIFVWLDVLSFLVQAGGGSIMSQDGGNIVRIGQTVYMVGIGIQGLFIIIFSAMTQIFYVKLLRLDRNDIDITRVKHLVWSMCAVLVLIMVRIIFRLVEFGPGVSRDNPILTNENYALGLDALPMLIALVLLNTFHPGLVLRRPDSEFPRLTRKEKKIQKREKKDMKMALKEQKARAKSSRRAGRAQQVHGIEA